MPEPRPSYPRDYYSKPIPLKDIAFILMPFDGFDDVHTAIRNAVKHARTLRPDLADLKPVRADDLHRKVVLEKILGQVGEAKVVIADLTGRNANVFYELGIAQTLKNNVILLAQNSKDVPADLQPFEYVPYTNSKEGLEKLVVDLAETIRQQPEEAPTMVLQDSGTSQDTRHRLRNMLRRCQQEWSEEILPAQDKVFDLDFKPRIAASQTRTDQGLIIQKAMETLHPAFHEPWQHVEDLGLDLIEEGLSGMGRDLLKALELPYRLSSPVLTNETVLGHGQLLVARTWTLWGAYALERQNWEAVDTLLHQRLTLTKPGWRTPKRTALGSFKYVFAPDATGLRQGGGDVAMTIRFILDQSADLAEKRFIDAAELRGYVGLWLLASDLAEATARDDHRIDYPAWPYVPERDLEGILPLLANDRDYAKGFAGAVSGTDPAGLNALWQDGLRASLMDPRGLGAEQHLMIFRELPERFAE